MTAGNVWEIIVWGGLLLLLATLGCTAQPKVTKVLYEDRSAWIRLEENPGADRNAPSEPADADLVPSFPAVSSLLKGFRAEKDYNPGIISYAIGKKYYNETFVPAELSVLAPQLAKGLAMATSKERIAYCLTADWSANERFITTGWVYLKKPYLYFKLEEWRTPVRVKSPAMPTSQACLIKPAPGYKTSDRFFQLDYEPKALIVTHGPLGRSIYNGAGEVVFKLAEAAAYKPLLPRNQTDEDIGTSASDTLYTPAQQPESPKEVPSKSRTRAKPSGGTATGR